MKSIQKKIFFLNLKNWIFFLQQMNHLLLTVPWISLAGLFIAITVDAYVKRKQMLYDYEWQSTFPEFIKNFWFWEDINARK